MPCLQEPTILLPGNGLYALIEDGGLKEIVIISKTSQKNLIIDHPAFINFIQQFIRADISSKRFIEAKRWNNKAQKVNGTCQETRNINSALKSLEIKVYKSHTEMIDNDLPISSENLKKYMFDVEILPKVIEKTRLGVFKTHNLEIESLIGKGFAKGTYERYEVSYQHTEAFMPWKYNVKDVLLSQVNHEFVTSYDYYLRSVRNCANNTTVKYIKNFKKIVLIALANGWTGFTSKALKSLS